MAQEVVRVNEQYQSGYTYRLDAPRGEEFALNFTPDLTPKQMLQLGVFGGDYFKEVPKEFRLIGLRELNYHMAMVAKGGVITLG